MKYLALAIVFASTLSFGLSYTDSYTESRDGIDTVRSITYYYYGKWEKLMKVKKCTTIIDTYNEEVVSRVCNTIKK